MKSYATPIDAKSDDAGMAASGAERGRTATAGRDRRGERLRTPRRPGDHHGTSGASGKTNTRENDHGLSSSRKRSVPPTTSPALGRPVAT